MEEDKKRNGIFLVIVGVATLIVAIIGASFAYFSAQASSPTGAVNLTAHVFNADLTFMEELPPEQGTNPKLIPIDPTAEIENATAPNNTNMKYALNVRHSCVDDQGYRVCALYKLTITNNGDDDLTLDGAIVTNTNVNGSTVGATPFTNLTYAIVTKNNNTYSIETPATLNQDPEGVKETTILSDITVPAGVDNSRTYYVLIYLNENGDQSAEMGATYTGQFVFTSTSDSNSRLTGTFTVN